MDISISKSESEVQVKISGPINESDGENLKNTFNNALNELGKNVVVDLTYVPTITSSGISKILVLLHQLKKQNRELAVAGIHNNLHTLFSSINLDKLIKIRHV